MKAKTADFEDILLQPGLYPCRLCQIIDIGTQKSNFDPAGNAQLIFALEFPTVMHTFNQEKGPEPLVKYRWFGNSLGPKSKMKEAIQGILGRNIDKDFPLDTLVPSLCQVMVGVEPKTDGTGWKQKFLAFMPATPEILAANFPMSLDHFVFDMDNFNPEVFNAISSGIQKIIAESKEYAAAISSGRFAGMMPAGGPAAPVFAGQAPAGVPGYQQPQYNYGQPAQQQPAAAPQWTPPVQQQAPAAPQWTPPGQPAAAPAPAAQPQWTPPGQPALGQPAAQPQQYPSPQPYTPGQAGQLPWEQPAAQPGPTAQPQHLPQTPPPSQWMSPPAQGGQPQPWGQQPPAQPGVASSNGMQLPPPGQPAAEAPKTKRGGRKIG